LWVFQVSGTNQSSNSESETLPSIQSDSRERI
jgi:hypothetical protein